MPKISSHDLYFFFFESEAWEFDWFARSVADLAQTDGAGSRCYNPKMVSNLLF